MSKDQLLARQNEELTHLLAEQERLTKEMKRKLAELDAGTQEIRRTSLASSAHALTERNNLGSRHAA